MNAISNLARHASSDSLKLVSDILTFLKSKAKYEKVRFISRRVYFSKIQVTMKMLVGKVEIEGTGCANTKDEATLKSVVELFERYIFLTQKVDLYRCLENNSVTSKLIDIFSEPEENILSIIESTTNGVAAHTNVVDSVNGAVEEAIERHVLLKAMALDIKPKIINHEIMDTPLTDVCIRTYLWRGPLNKNVVAIKANFGNANCYGFGCSDTLSVAVEKAKCEIAPRMNILRMKKTYGHFKLRENEHFDYHLQRLSPWANNFFDVPALRETPEVDINLKINDFWCGEYNLPEDCKIANITVARAVSPKIQPLFNGKWSIEKMNMNAFDKTSFLKLPNELHMIG